MEGGPPVGGGASAMLQSQMAKDGKGGVIDVSSPIKGLDANTMEQLFGGNLQAAAQGFGGGFGLTAANAAELLNLKDLSATGLPALVGGAQEFLQDLERRGYVKIFQMGEDAVAIARNGDDFFSISQHEGLAIYDERFQRSDLHTQSAQIGKGLMGGLRGSAIEDCDPGRLYSPSAGAALGMSRGHAALGG